MANCRRHQAEMREMRHNVEELKKQQDHLRENASQADRRALAASHEAEEVRTLHDISEKHRRQLDNEVNSIKESLQVCF